MASPLVANWFWHEISCNLIWYQNPWNPNRIRCMKKKLERENEWYVRWNVVWNRKAKLMHHPVGFDTFRSSAFVEDKGFLQPNNAFSGIWRINGTISSSRFPKPSSCYSVWPCTVSVFSVPLAVKVPFLLSRRG